MDAMGEVGALDRGEVEKTFARATGEVDRCLDAGRKRIRPLHGGIDVLLRVDRNGRAVSTALQQATLGDRDTTRCIEDVYRRQQWPRPIGGKFGEIERRQEFGVADADLPAIWTAEKLASAMAVEASASFDGLLEQLRGCRQEASLQRLETVFYLDEDGFVPTVDVFTGEGKEAAAYDCVATVVKTTSFPSPGERPAKVTVSVK